MLIVAPLWLILIVLALTHPIKALKYGFAFLVGGAIGLVSTPEQDCIAFRSKDASMMPTRMPSSTGLSRGRQVGVRSSLGVSALLRRERRLL